MLSESARAVGTKDAEQELKTALQAAVEVGRWAERLSVNSDWLEFRKTVMVLVESKEKDKLKSYDGLIRGSMTTEEKLKVVDSIRETDLEIENFKTIMGTPDNLAKAGQEAQERLDDVNQPPKEK